MDDILYLESKEQLELIGDPFVLDILDALGYEVCTREEIIKTMNENPNMINDYLDNMIENNFLTVIEENVDKNKEKLRVTAKSIEGKGALFEHLDKKDLHWLRGYINHLENRIVDLYSYLAEFEDPEAKLKELNYTNDLYASSNKVYLTAEEANELTNMITEFIKQNQKEIKEKSEDKEHNLYEFYAYMFPELKEFKKKVEKDN
ncbi:MAG TPA: hypothetical protein VKN64_11965 [Halanaerobiales bacterium]|nr:hypothetical protein [Halanaerobiales bacterium]